MRKLVDYPPAQSLPMLAGVTYAPAVRDPLATLKADVADKREVLLALQSTRNAVAARSAVSLRFSDIQSALAADFEAPSELALVWIDREIDAAKANLRKALVALRDYAVTELDAL